MQLFLGAIFPPFSTRNTLLPPLPVFEAAQTTCSAKAATVGPQTTPRGEEHEDTKLTINFLSLELFFPTLNSFPIHYSIFRIECCKHQLDKN